MLLILLAACLPLVIGGCGSDGGVTPPPSGSNPPEVTIVSAPPDLLQPGEAADFIWRGSDPDGDLARYYAGLNGAFQFHEADDTTASFTGLIPNTFYTFRVFAVDAANQHSDTVEAEFSIDTAPPPEIDLVIDGLPVTDSDGDDYWSEYAVLWSPRVNTPYPVDMYLWVSLRPTFNLAGAIIADSSDLVTRQPNASDTLIFTLPSVEKDFYSAELELRDANDSVLVHLPYDSIDALSGFGLEPIEGTSVWVDSAWTANRVDALPAGSPDGVYESLEVWWDADAWPDAARIKMVVYKRNAAEEEYYAGESFPYEVSGINPGSGQENVVIEAQPQEGLDTWDFRLVVLDENNNLLDEVPYGRFAGLNDIPMGIPTGLQR
ncbi:MAG: fibronectin type III domain-containing protein [Candidatus Zixiibacteriota bacterium]|nr:MAG: fibronectin type III domain-containing protein [candidate division Zixibacteria bacterium]